MILTDPAVSTAVLVVPPATEARRDSRDIVDEWGMDSFPASDPPANW